MNVLLDLSSSWVFLALALIGLAAAVFFYRRVPPTVSVPVRALLVVLRSTAVALLCVVLAEPVLSLSRTVTDRPVIAVLIDSSRSMSIEDGTNGARRGDEAMTLVNEIVLPRLGHDADIVAYSFSSSVSPLGVERRVVEAPGAFDGRVTDAASALAHVGEELSGRNLQAIVMATDGASNVGGSMYEAGTALGVPVFTLGVGSATPAADVAVREVRTNRISYEGESVPVEVRVSSVGYEGAETVVELREGDVLIDSRTVLLSGTGEESLVAFSVVPDGPGLHRYTASIPAAPGELTKSNNSRVAATTSFKGKLKVLLAAERPGWDYAFLKRHFEADRNVELAAHVVLGDASSAGAGALAAALDDPSDYDLVVIVGEAWDKPPLDAARLAEFVTSRGGGLMLVGTPAAAAEGPLADVLPVSFTGGDGTAVPGAVVESRLELTPAGESSATVRLVSERAPNALLWSSLPPVWVVSSGVEVRAGESELVSSVSPRAPVVVSGRSGRGSVMVVAAEGLWRWKMRASEDDDSYDRFVSGAARWLTARGELRRVVAQTDRDVYSAGEVVGVTAQAYGEDYRPRADAAVTVRLSRARGAAPVADIPMVAEGDTYTASLGSLEAGEYFFDVEASVSGERIGEDEGEFVVERFSLEDAETRMRPALLQRLADDTGGAFCCPATLDALPEGVPMSWTSRRLDREIELWNSPWMLLAAVGLLSVEWALRRRKGLP